MSLRGTAKIAADTQSTDQATTTLANKQRDHLSSNQQLLIKQTIALKGTIDFRRLENRVIGINQELKFLEPSKQRRFEAFESLLCKAEQDITSLRMQSVTTQALLSFFARRHRVSIKASAQGLMETIQHLNQSVSQIRAQFKKAHGPGFFRKHGSLDVSQYDQWVVKLANEYKQTLLTLHEWHKSTAAALVKASSSDCAL